MHRIIIPLFLLIAATTLRAQSLLDITSGISRDSAMRIMTGSYTVADTVLKERWGYDYMIRLAPVRLADYDGWVVLHSDSAGRMTSLSWSRGPLRSFAGSGDKRWQRVTDWERWETPTREDAERIATRLDSLLKQRGYHTGGMIRARISSLSDTDTATTDPDTFKHLMWSNSRERITIRFWEPIISVTRTFVLREGQ